jgi:cellulose biosynthesis protein BcsQ
MMDSPSKIGAIALAAIRAADMIVCPTLPDLFNLASLQDTVRLLEATGNLGVTVGVINNVDKAGEGARIGEAKAVMEKFQMAVSSAVIRHRSEFQIAVEKGKAVTELSNKGKVAAEEIRALWSDLDGRMARPESVARSKRKAKEAKR